MGGPHPISFPTIGQNTSQPPAQQNSTNCLWTLSVTSALPSSAADCRQTGTGHQLSCISSLLAHPADFGFTSLCNCVSQFLITGICIYVYISPHLFPLMGPFNPLSNPVGKEGIWPISCIVPCPHSQGEAEPGPQSSSV